MKITCYLKKVNNSFVLYIDDDPDALELYQDILGEDFHVETCREPFHSLNLIAEKVYDAILLDIYMPEINGFDLFDKIRKIETNVETPVFFISSENTIQNRVRALGLGSEDFIPRDMNPDEVIARIKNRLNKVKTASKNGSNRPPNLIFGDIEIDQQRLIARCNGQIIELTQTEYRLLFLLVKEALERPDSILSRDAIIKFVWPLDHESVWPRTLSTHLTNLRKKLNSQNIKISSKRQEGFKLELS